MEKIDLVLNGKAVWVHVSENLAEDLELDTLAREVKLVTAMSKKTRLVVLADFSLDERKVVVMTFREDEKSSGGWSG